MLGDFTDLPAGQTAESNSETIVLLPKPEFSDCDLKLSAAQCRPGSNEMDEDSLVHLCLDPNHPVRVRWLRKLGKIKFC